MSPAFDRGCCWRCAGAIVVMGGCAHIYSAMANAGAPDAADPAAAALGQDLGAANAVGLANAAQGGLHNLAMPALAQWQTKF